MNRLQGRRVLITGASSGIGEACARTFAAAGAHLLLSARRLPRLRSLEGELRGAHGVQVDVERLDVRDRAAVDAYVARLFGSDLLPDVLVNNAGLSRGLEPIHQGDVEGWDEMIDTNVKGLLYMTRAVLPHMVERDRGHVIHTGSIAGDTVYPSGNVYNATKFAVKALTEAMSLDLVGTRIRVSSVDPGLVETEFSEVRFHGDRERAAEVYRGYTPLSSRDVADVVLFVANAPAHVNVFRTVVYPTDQRNPYVLHREDPPAGDGSAPPVAPDR
jgi:3-hydroxy acid dehydrogenase / malonic semialdehyde reductase